MSRAPGAPVPRPARSQGEVSAAEPSSHVDGWAWILLDGHSGDRHGSGQASLEYHPAHGHTYAVAVKARAPPESLLPGPVS